MGMESYNIMILPENVNIVREKEYWKLCGTTEIFVSVIENELKKLCINSSKNNEYILNQCGDIKMYKDKMLFQGFELRGCFSYLEGGVKICYEFYEFWKDIVPLNIFVLNELINIENENDLYETICYMYSEKINIFKKQYGDIELKVTSGNFYQEIRRRKKWYYKIFSLVRSGKP